MTAYATYRMMLVYVLQGNLVEARVAYGTLEQLPQDAAGRPYADLAVTFWEEYSASGDVAAACARAADFAEAFADEILAPLGSGFYGHQNRNYEGDEICPFE